MTNKLAVLIKSQDKITEMGSIAKQKLYKLNVPHEGFDYVLVSSVLTPISGPETFIFGANSEGEIKNWMELTGSYVGGLEHETALNGAGYEIEETQ